MSVETRLMTAEEFEEFIALPENQDRHFELFQGELIEDMPTEEHGMVAGRIFHYLFSHAELNLGLGRVVLEVRRKKPEDDYTALIPDIDFTSNERLEARNMEIVRSGPVLQMPDLAVEVQSPGQSPKFMADKAAYYLENGVRMVWLVYPAKQIIEVLTPDSRELLTIEDTLDGGDVVPGFSVPVQKLFPMK